ncbi:ABATE domain-containing protein [Kitasatospora sp. NPDC094015]|uniref:CGNR zinc finger domain-containing protein n=1 Tax=Kitasatospora sp. NPDC094015 TaxID=3155205 RepID=UPI00332E3922
MDLNGYESGGAPLLGEPLPIELANATYAVRGRLVDGLATVEHAAAWLRDNRARFATALDDEALLALGEEDLRSIRSLRDAARALIDAAARGTEAPGDAVGELNRQVRRAPSWRELAPGPAPATLTRSAATPVAAALGEIAQATVDLVTGPDRDLLRACQAPGCVLYFLKNHPRREWSGPDCGNRARAARHYERTKQG